MKIKLFVKDDCPRCPAAKHALSGFESIEVFDVEDVDGLAEASFYSILSTPSVLIVDAQGREIEGWRGETPDIARIRGLIAQ